MPLKTCLPWILCTALLAAALPSHGVGQSEAPEVKVGVLVSLTGPNAEAGRSAVRAVRLCFDQANIRSGAPPITTVVADDGGDPLRGAEETRRLIEEEGVSLICGPLSSAVALRAAAVAQEHGIPMLSPTATHPALTLIGDSIFRSCFTAAYQALIAAQYAYSVLDARRSAVLYSSGNDSSRTLAEVFRLEFTALGGEITGFEEFPPGGLIYADRLQSTGSDEPDLLYLPVSYYEAARIAAQVRAEGIRGRLLGSDTWDSPDLLRIAPAALENALFVHPAFPGCDSATCREFSAAYRRAYGEDPDSVAALSYEAALVLAAAIGGAGSTEPAVLRASIASSDLDTLAGRFTFDAMRNPVRAAAILGIENGRIVYREAYRADF